MTHAAGEDSAGSWDDPEGVPAVKQSDRNRARGLVLAGAGLLSLAALGSTGCGDPSQGTVQVPADTHARFQPRNSVKAKLGQAAPGNAAGKSVSDAKPVNK
jgi:hypothetical protein